MELNKKLEIGFRVKKVSIDRGGWFNPTIFKLSDNYYRLADIRVSKGLTKTDVHKASSAGMNSAAQLNELVTYEAEVNGEHKKLSYVLPSFPTGFVIAKDITIRIQCDKTSAESSRKYMEQSDARGGGIFGFRANSGSSSKSQSESAYFVSTSNFFYIRIPGPQILAERPEPGVPLSGRTMKDRLRGSSEAAFLPRPASIRAGPSVRPLS